MVQGRAVDFAFMDFGKAIDKAPHDRLNQTIKMHRIHMLCSTSEQFRWPNPYVVNIRCTLSKVIISFLQLGDKNCTQNSRCGLTRVMCNCSRTILLPNSNRLAIKANKPPTLCSNELQTLYLENNSLPTAPM